MSSEPVFNSAIWQPNEGRQTLFLTAGEDVVGYGGSAGSGKALALSTLVPVPGGFKRLGDIQDGDTVFDENGKPCTVIKAHEPFRGRNYKVVFDDNTEFIACADHRWLTFDYKERVQLAHRNDQWRRNRREKRASKATGKRSAAFTAAVTARNRAFPTPVKPVPTGTVRTTAEIAATLLARGGSHLNHAIPVCSPLEHPERDLPMDPYLLGAWLGDGTTTRAEITTVDDEILQAFVARYERGKTGKKPGAITHSFLKMLGDLKATGALGFKRIPEEYITASVQQRLALIQGMMDTDGTVNKTSGSSIFTTTSPDLLEGFKALVHSMGWKCSVSYKVPTLNGKQCSPCWNVSFMPDRKVFRLERKASLQKPAARSTNRFRYIRFCERDCNAEMVRCLTVDSPSRLFLVGEECVPTHNTEVLNFHHLYLADFENQRWFRGEIAESKAWCIHMRRIGKNIEQSKQRFLSVVPLVDTMKGKDGWNEQKGTYTYSSGLKYMFAGLEKPTDYLKYLSFEFVELNFDELTEFEEDQFDWMCTRQRASDPALKPFFSIRWGSNPTGPGLDWVRRRWIAGKETDRTYRRTIQLADKRTVSRTEVFFQAFLRDNKWLHEDGQYEASLRASKPHLAEILLNGNWWVQRGSFLGAFWDPRAHVCEDHPIPRNVLRFRSCDFGIGSHSSITWWYVDMDGCFTAYHHLYLHDLTSSQQADRIKEVEKYYGDWNWEDNCSMLNGPLDAQCFKRHGASGPSISEDFRLKGVPWRRSSKDRFNGLAEVCKRLSARIPKHEGDAPVPGADPALPWKPMIRWMRRCSVPIEILPTVPGDPRNPGEVLSSYPHLHPLDDTMFACMTHVIKPNNDVDGEDWDDPEDIKEAWRRKDARRIASIL